MGRYLKQARAKAKEIEYFHEHAGAKGYAQARYYYQELYEILKKAHYSQIGVHEVPLMLEVCKACDKMMEEMKAKDEKDRLQHLQQKYNSFKDTH